ncbi:MAG: CubicO group peptidase (beta-lactamase class C family) [Halioglobus sp.]|jgi:CubicO group peptidase (beta-lactamase class C family)
MAFSDTHIYNPDELGLDAARLDDLRGRLRHAIEKGPLPSVQIAVARNGKLGLFETYGEADNSTRFNVYSCTKPIVASAIWRLIAEGLIEIEKPVSHYLEIFGDNEKQAVTVEQVLCHTAGFPRATLGAPQWWSSTERLEAMRSWRLEWEPNSRMEYHPLSAHWVLAQLIEQLTGRDFREYIQAEIIAPLGLEKLRLGVPVTEQEDIAILRHVGAPPDSEELTKLFGATIEWPNTIDDSLLVFNEPEVRALGVPGGGAVSTAADMALFYQGLLHNPNELWDADILADAIGRVRVNFPDPITKVAANRGLGIVIAGSGKELPYRGMGQKVSPRAIGHQGVGGQVAWGDPDSGISFCLLTNGLDANPLRSAQICGAASNRAAVCGKKA